MRRIFLALVMVLAPGVAAALQDTCTFSAGGNWSAIGTHPTASCTGGDNNATIDSSDIVVIPSGITITITGNVTQGTTAGAGITVQNGGTLTGTVSLSVNSGNEIVLTVGSAGLTCEAGSTCNLSGAYVAVAASATLDTTPSTTSYLAFGDATPCPGSDCTLERISYLRDRYNIHRGSPNPSLDSNIDNTITVIHAGDILCFWNPAGAVAFGTPDVNACYPVSAVGTTGSGATTTYYIDFQVRLTGAQQPVPYKAQDIYTGTISATTAATKGSRTIKVPAATIASGEEPLWVGRWIRLSLSGSATDYEPFAYRILSVTDGGGGDDTITLASLAGLANDYAVGAIFAIDYGWRRGDPFIVYRPFKIASATSALNDSPITFSGTVNLKAVHIALPKKFEFLGASVVPGTLTDIFIQDGDVGDSGLTDAGVSVNIKDSTASYAFNRVSIIGGDSNAGAAGSTVHGFGFASSGSPKLSVTDSLLRYIGDDCFVSEPNVSGSMSVTRTRCQWGAYGGESESFFDSGTSSVAFTASQIECLDCVNHGTDSPELFAMSNGVGATLSANGVLAYGVRGSIHRYAWPSSASVSNLEIIGGGSATVSGTSWMVPTATNFVVRDVAIGGTYPNAAYLYNNISGDGPLRWTNGLFRDVSQSGTVQYGVTPTTASAYPYTVDNVAFVDLTNSVASSTLFLLPASVPNGSLLSRITIAYSPSFTAASEFQYGFSLNDTTPVYTLNKTLFYGMARTSAIGITNASSAKLTGLTKDHLCFFGVYAIGGGLEASLSSDSVADRPQDFLDKTRRRYSGGTGYLRDQIGCGATPAAGITRYQWIHAISDLEPESLGTIGSGSGSGGWTPKAF